MGKSVTHAPRAPRPVKLSRPRVREVLIQDYRSIARANLVLGDITYLIGPNGSGKSNLLDSLLFLSSSTSSLDDAIRQRGGISETLRKSKLKVNGFEILMQAEFPHEQLGHFGLAIAPTQSHGFQITHESAGIRKRGLRKLEKKGSSYTVESGRVITEGIFPSMPVPHDRAYLSSAAMSETLLPIYDLVRGIATYALNTTCLRDVPTFDPGDVLYENGGNIAAVWRRMKADANGFGRTGMSQTTAVSTRVAMERILAYLRIIVPGVLDVDVETVANRDALIFRMKGEDNFEKRLPASSMSDGSLRAFGILTALFQVPLRPLYVIGIEEPEMALYPAALTVLLEALQEASELRQIVVTSHSPDLLDSFSISGDQIRLASLENGLTQVGSIDEISKQIIRDKLSTPGELLRQNQMSRVAEPHLLPVNING